jgi:hypothetical protein
MKEILLLELTIEHCSLAIDYCSIFCSLCDLCERCLDLRVLCAYAVKVLNYVLSLTKRPASQRTTSNRTPLPAMTHDL